MFEDYNIFEQFIKRQAAEWYLAREENIYEGIS